MKEVAAEVPPKFYKYRSMKGEAEKWVERTVLHDEVFFASASTFNDVFDLKPVFSLEASPERQREDFLKMSRKYSPELTEEQHLTEADRVMATSMSPGEIEYTTNIIQALHSQAITTKVGVFCVSTKRDDILMWSHYAESHAGICLEFDGSFAFMAHAQEVRYSDDRRPINPYDDDDQVKMDKALLTKSERWAYESEWRLIRYAAGPGVVRFRPHNLTGIILGAMVSHSTVETVRRWSRERTKPVQLYRAITSNKKFELNIAPC